MFVAGDTLSRSLRVVPAHTETVDINIGKKQPFEPCPPREWIGGVACTHNLTGQMSEIFNSPKGSLLKLGLGLHDNNHKS